MASSACVSLILFFTIFEIINAAQLKNQQSKPISLGSSLSPSSEPSSWTSPSGLFQFGFYKEGTGFSVGTWLVTSPNITVIWTAFRDEPPVSSNAKLILTMDGLVLQTEESKHKLIANTTSDEPASFASILDSGNFVLCNDRFDFIWESFNFPTHTIVGGQSLVNGSKLFSSASETNSSTGRFCLEQRDGILVLYPVRDSRQIYWVSKLYWASDRVHGMVNLTPGGILQAGSADATQILARSSYSVKSSNETVIYRATLDFDGILRLYSHHFTSDSNYRADIEWYVLQNQCLVKGFCGFNSFCSNPTNSSTKGECFCFRGFNFINPEMKFLGCYRNFTDEEGCKRKMPAEFYKITSLEISQLGGMAYAKLSVNEKDCSKSCLNDCYCGAAIYANASCSKHKLPLIFAMKYQNVPATLFIKWSSGQANLSTNLSALPIVSKKHGDNKKKLVSVLAACLGSITFLCFLIAISSLLAYKQRVNQYQKLRINSSLGPSQEFIIQSFSTGELERATNGFEEELGRGCFGAVYKGSICEGNKIVAVKRLENPVEEGERKFQAEMAAVRRTHHKNLVRLLGFCMQTSKKLLVYEFMSKGSLENLLSNVESGPIWRDRVRIALDVARGITYLHEECEVQIIHCNINPRNILLDDSLTAKISNFSLAKILMPNQTGIVTGVKGTRGYMSPEWQNSGLITVKSDVYSFGVVVLEIVCCRSNFEVNVSTADVVLLSTWVYNCFIAKELNKLVGEDEEVDLRTLETMVRVGLLCIQDEPNLRPSMKNVILMLEGTMEIPVVPFPILSNFSSNSQTLDGTKRSITSGCELCRFVSSISRTSFGYQCYQC